MSSSPEILFAPRGTQFVDFIKSVLMRCTFSKSELKTITNDEACLTRFKDAFTHESADPDRNYEFLEKIGDSCVNKCIRFYIIKKFPSLHTKQGVEYISELESKWKSTSYLSSFADKLNFKSFISADVDSISKNIRTRSEDVFEAFIGALELNVDSIRGDNTGYGVCYEFMTSLLDEIKVVYSYEQLINSKSRLNELFLGLKDNSLKLTYSTTSRVDKKDGRIFRSNIVIGGKTMGDSIHFNKLDKEYLAQIGLTYTPPYRRKIVAEKVAAEVAIYNLIRQSRVNKSTNLYTSVQKMYAKKALNPFK